LLPQPDQPAAVAPEAASRPAAAEHGLASFHLYWWLSLAVVVVDQIVKAIVRARLPLFDSASIIPGFLAFTHVRNSGVAFGLLNDFEMPPPLKAVVTTALAALALAGIGFYARHVHKEERLARIGLSLILGGAVGNLADRLRVQYVIDFVDVYWRGWHFWAFNLADAAISVGAVFIFIDLVLVTRHASHSV
jgi:signal peptidase II